MLSSEFNDWDWYCEYRSQIEAAKTNPNIEWSKAIDSDRLPVDIGIDFSRWVLETPELSDIVYRRIVLGDYDNVLEANLLSDATQYFLNKRRILGGGGLLSACWLSLADVLRGNIEAIDTPAFRASLLKSKFTFTETKNDFPV
jgi:hypothetical protein